MNLVSPEKQAEFEEGVFSPDFLPQHKPPPSKSRHSPGPYPPTSCIQRHRTLVERIQDLTGLASDTGAPRAEFWLFLLFAVFSAVFFLALSRLRAGGGDTVDMYFVACLYMSSRNHSRRESPSSNFSHFSQSQSNAGRRLACHLLFFQTAGWIYIVIRNISTEIVFFIQLFKYKPLSPKTAQRSHFCSSVWQLERFEGSE